MLGRRFARSGAVEAALRQRPAGAGEGLLSADAYERFARRVDAASRKARGGDGATLVSVTCAPAPDLIIDPVAVLEAARALRADDAVWFEHPELDGHAIAGFGAAAVVTAVGPQRFAKLAHAQAERCAGMLADDPFDDPDAPRGSGVAWLGGFAFGDDDPRSNHWLSFGAARFVLPRIVFTRRQGGAPASRLTVNLVVHRGDDVGATLAQVDEELAALTAHTDPSATQSIARTASSAAAEHYVDAVRRGVERIRAGEFEKLVLARELELESSGVYEPAGLARSMRERFPGCLSFVVVHGEKAFVGATPELLVRREGRRVSTMALAGSARRGLDTAADVHLGRELLASAKDREEHAIVVRRIEHTLGRMSAWVAAGQEPDLVKVKNIQHLATPIRAQLLEPRPVLELAGSLHPTPAVGGEPWPQAAAAIAELEGFDRGWYTGCVGWTDSLEDGELYVGLRCALVDGRHARLFAGAGIVAESDPSSELAETETKLEALLPVLGGSSQ